MKIITIGSQVFLGTLKFDDDKITLSDSLPVSGTNVTKADLAQFLTAQNAGTLDKPVDIRGSAAVFSERDLSDDLQSDLEILEKQLAKAKKIAIPNLVNQEFAKLAR